MSYKIDLGSLVSTPWKNPYFEKKDCSQNEVNLISDSIIYQNDNSKIPNFTQYVTNHQQEELFGTNEYYIKTVTLSDLDSNFLATYKIANASTEEEIAMDDLDFYLANTTSFHPSDNEIFSKFLLPEINIFQSVNGDVPRLSIKEMYADDPEGYEKLKEEILGKIAINDARITREKPYLDVLEELETEIDDIEREINVLSDPANRAIIYDKGGAVTEQNKAINQANRDARAKLESKLATKKMQYRQTDVQIKLLD